MDSKPLKNIAVNLRLTKDLMDGLDLLVEEAQEELNKKTEVFRRSIELSRADVLRRLLARELEALIQRQLMASSIVSGQVSLED